MEADFLKRALELAVSRRGFCAPNPSVGAVLVKDGQILGESAHWAAGHPHAEVGALSAFDKETCREATLYVSLEPCCHYGRTPPCTSLIIEKGIRKVVYGFRDPNPIVSGKGAALLEAAGVSVAHLELPEVQAFYESYRFWTLNKRPFVTAKIALSLDGKTAGAQSKPVKITGEAADLFTHTCRLKADAILTSAQTILFDNPQLNARLDGIHHPKPVVILDREGRTPFSARVFKTASKVLLCLGPSVSPSREEEYRALGAETVRFPEVENLLPLDKILLCLGAMGYHDVWLEAGGALFSGFLNTSNAQKAYVFVSPLVIGPDGQTAFTQLNPFKDAKVVWSALGRDTLGEFTFLAPAQS